MEVSLELRITTGATKRTAETQLTPNSVEGYTGGLRSFDGHQDVQTHLMSATETVKEDSAAETIDEDSRRYDYYTGELLDRAKNITGRKKEFDQLESFGVIRREATDGIHVRMKIIAHNKGDLVRWTLVIMVNQFERHDVFAGTLALKVVRMLTVKAARHSHTEHGQDHRKPGCCGCILSHRHGRRDIRTSTSRSRARSHCRVVVDQSSPRNAESCLLVAGVSAQ